MTMKICQTATLAALMVLATLAGCRVFICESFANENGEWRRRLMSFGTNPPHHERHQYRRLQGNCETLVSSSVNGDRYFIQARHSGHVLAIENDSTANGASVVQRTLTPGLSTGEWYLIQTSDPGYYWVVNTDTLLDLNVASANTGNRANIIQWPFVEAKTDGNNEWCFEPVGDLSDDYYMVARHSGKVLDIDLASKDEDANAIQYEKKSTEAENQQFKMVKIVATSPPTSPLVPPSACDSTCASQTEFQELLIMVNSLTNEIHSFQGNIGSSISNLGQRLDLVENDEMAPPAFTPALFPTPTPFSPFFEHYQPQSYPTGYFVYPSGEGNSPTFSARPSVTPPLNDQCENAELVSNSALGTTEYATRDQLDSFFCGRGNASSSWGVWYTVIGTGESMRASTCGSTSRFYAGLSLFAGSCSALECIKDYGDSCGTGDTIIWKSIANVEYKILVSGYTSETGNLRRGEFKLDVESSLLQFCPPVLEDCCSICGEDMCIGNAEAVFSVAGQPSSKTCEQLQSIAANCEIECELEQLGLENVSVDVCDTLPDLIGKLCECQPGVPTPYTPVAPAYHDHEGV